MFLRYKEYPDLTAADAKRLGLPPACAPLEPFSEEAAEALGGLDLKNTQYPAKCATDGPLRA